MKYNCSDIPVVAASLLVAVNLVVSGTFVAPDRHAASRLSVRAPAPPGAMPPSQGFVFFNDRYVQPPYVVRLESETTLSINGERIAASELDLSHYDSELSRRVRGTHCALGSTHLEQETAAAAISLLQRDIEALLSVERIVVLTDNHPPLMIQDSNDCETMLATLYDRQGPSSHRKMAFAPAAAEKTWDRLVRHFEASPEFRSRTSVLLAETDRLQKAGVRVMTANLRVDAIAYPLHTFAMLVVVLAFGHLLSNKPCLENVGDVTQQHDHTRRVVTRSLILFGLLSAIDLLWTIAAAQSGNLREMNPLGNALIHDPILLAAFKSVAVVTTIGLLLRLHASPSAQVASWWSCLVLTLLTARWLVFHSMLI